MKNKNSRAERDWFRLDTAALIFPAIMRKNWSNAFRMSVEMKDDIDPDILQQAVNDLQERFPSFYVRLCRGFFWYYLRKINTQVTVQSDFAYPLTHMNKRELSKCCLRVLYYRNRIAVEFFHSLTDGSGGKIFISTLAARYISLRYGIDVPANDTVLDPMEHPSDAELEDSFWKNAAIRASSRTEDAAYRLKGEPIKDGFLHITTGIISTKELLAKAHEYNCTITCLLASVMAECISTMQAEKCERRKCRPVKITIPVDLRRLYNSRTLRNFALTLNPGIDPRLGDHTIEELCAVFKHQLALEATPQKMSGMIAANVLPQRNILIRLCPVFVKNLVMDAVYRASGEKNGCLNISNLGKVKLPAVMEGYLKRMDFVVGVQRSYPNNCSVISCGDVTCINMIRNIHGSELERRFFSRLVELGVAVEIESNRRKVCIV